MRMTSVSQLVRSPVEVSQELTNHCNLNCVMCFRESMTREKGLMDFDLAKRAIDGLKAFPKALFLPQGFGESLMYPDFVDVLRYARSVLPNTIAMITNGTLLTPEISSQIVQESLADVIVFSVESADKGQYEQIRRGGDFESLVANITSLFEIRRSLGVVKPRICIRGVAADDGSSTVESLQGLWGEFLSSGDQIAVNEFRSWGGIADQDSLGAETKRKTGRIRRLACRQLFRTFMIGFNGDVTPCCYDFDFSLRIGNITESSFKSLWMGSELARLRDLHLRGRFAEIPLCSQCKDWE